MQHIKVTEGQWLGDIAIREAGDISVLFDLAVKNNLSLSGDLPIGLELKPVPVANQRMVNYLQKYDVHPASRGNVSVQIRGRGIGNMVISKDFIVG